MVVSKEGNSRRVGASTAFSTSQPTNATVNSNHNNNNSGTYHQHGNYTYSNNNHSHASNNSNNGGNGNAHHHQHSNGKDPMWLLARGCTSRLLTPLLSPLSAEEMDKDLRHMEAYYHAVVSYRQHAYRTTRPETAEDTAMTASTANSNNNNYGITGTPGGTNPPILPVKIDPELDKRRQLLHQRIQKAEAQREALESQYVALRAHYVQVSQDLQQALQKQDETQTMLQTSILRNQAKAVAWARAKLQMARDVAKILKARQADTTATSLTGAYNFSVHDPLRELWQAMDEGLTQSLSNATASGNKTIDWPATTWTATPSGVPLLLSNLSRLPEKTIAMSVPGAFGSKKDSLIWLEEYMPTISEHHDTSTSDDITGELEFSSSNKTTLNIPAVEKQVSKLSDEVVALRNELRKERLLNQQCIRQAGKARRKCDEWVAMMALLRHETEAVLQRYNIVLESSSATAMAQYDDDDDDEDDDDDLDDEDKGGLGGVEDSMRSDNANVGTSINDRLPEIVETGSTADADANADRDNKRSMIDDDNLPMKRQKK